MSSPLFKKYLNHGWVLTPIKPGEKGAYIPGWSSDPSVNVNTLGKLPMLNGAAGLCLSHGRYPILSVDLDDMQFDIDWFLGKGMDLHELMARPDSVMINSGAKNKGKLLYRLDKPIITKKVLTPNGKTALEFRCMSSEGNSLQDVLPPSPYPVDPGEAPRNYEWGGNGNWWNLPMAPKALLDILEGLGATAEPKVREAAEDAVVGDTPLPDILRALDKVPAAGLSYDERVKVGMAIHSEQPFEDGLNMFHAWSKIDSDRYDPAAADKAWYSFRQSPDGIGIGSLFDMVQKAEVLDFPTMTTAEQERIDESELEFHSSKDLSSEIAAQSSGFLLVPGVNVDFNVSAQSILTEAKQQGRLYRREYGVVEIRPDGSLNKVSPEGFVSIVDELGVNAGRPVMGVTVNTDNTHVNFRHQRCSVASAKALLNSRSIQCLDEIRMVTNTPFLADDGTILEQGYHGEYGVYVTGGDVETVEFDEAVKALLSLFDDFNPYEPSDLSRLMAAIITPALKPSKMVTHSPIMFYEADQSQAGKGLAAETPPLIFNSIAENVKQRNRGAGSLEESVDAALIAGRQFVNIDNFRGKLDSGYIEGLITAGANSHRARIAFKAAALSDTTTVNWALTSNGMTSTADLVNRINYIKLRKQPDGYDWKYKGKDLYHNHVRENQGYYLGCVFAVVQRWIADGKPVADAGGHTFIQWAGALDYIVTRYFGLPPLMKDAIARKKTISDPLSSWVRLMCMAVANEDGLGDEMTATTIVDIVTGSPNGVDTLPGGKELSTYQSGQQAQTLGRTLSRLRKRADGKNAIQVDEFTITFDERYSIEAERQWLYTVTRDGELPEEYIPF